MEVGGLGITEIIILLGVFLLFVGVPAVVIVALVLFFKRRNRSNAGTRSR